MTVFDMRVCVEIKMKRFLQYLCMF